MLLNIIGHLELKGIGARMSIATLYLLADGSSSSGVSDISSSSSDISNGDFTFVFDDGCALFPPLAAALTGCGVNSMSCTTRETSPT
nr:hypothetical protein [Tanacetum cinerariifolium]